MHCLVFFIFDLYINKIILYVVFCDMFFHSTLYLLLNTVLLTYNSHAINFAVLKCVHLMIFSIFTKLCKHHHHLTPEYFHHPPKELLRLLEVTLHSPLPSPWKPPVCVLCLWTCPPWTSHADGIIQCAIFCIWLLSLSLMFSGFIHIVDVSVLHYGNFGNAPF